MDNTSSPSWPPASSSKQHFQRQQQQRRQSSNRDQLGWRLSATHEAPPTSERDPKRHCPNAKPKSNKNNKQSRCSNSDLVSRASFDWRSIDHIYSKSTTGAAKAKDNRWAEVDKELRDLRRYEKIQHSLLTVEKEMKLMKYLLKDVGGDGGGDGTEIVVSKMNEIDQSICHKIEGIEGRMESLCEKVESIEGRMDTIFVKMESIEGKVDAMSISVCNKMESIGRLVESLSQKMDTAYLKMESIDEKLDTMATHFQSLRHSVDNVSDRLNNINVTRNDEIGGIVRSEQDKQTGRLKNYISRQVVPLKKDVNEMNVKLEDFKKNSVGLRSDIYDQLSHLKEQSSDGRAEVAVLNALARSTVTRSLSKCIAHEVHNMDVGDGILTEGNNTKNTKNGEQAHGENVGRSSVRVQIQVSKVKNTSLETCEDVAVNNGGMNVNIVNCDTDLEEEEEEVTERNDGDTDTDDNGGGDELFESDPLT